MRLIFRNFKDIDGVLIRTSGGAWAGIRANLPLGRKRFTIAHELGHYLLHDGIQADTLCQNPASKIEREANRFASELLIPENLVKKTITQLDSLGLKNINHLEEISWAFKVSKEAMLIRLKNLKIIT